MINRTWAKPCREGMRSKLVDGCGLSYKAPRGFRPPSNISDEASGLTNRRVA